LRFQLIEARFFGEPEAVRTVRDIQIQGPESQIGVRLYFPDSPAPHPIVMFIHGGGWVLGDFPTHERFVRDLVSESGALAVFVNYKGEA